MEHLLYISEQYRGKALYTISDYLRSVLIENQYETSYFHNKEMICFRICKENEAYFVTTNYFIGADWVVPGKAAVYVEPKLNNALQVDFTGMLLESLKAPENIEHLEGLFYADYEQPWILMPGEKDILSPLLLIRFLKLLQKIVRKGLKKSYYYTTQNLESRVKGKLMMGRQFKENIARNRLTRTVCNYEDYGINTAENQFLKLVLEFVSAYINQNKFVFGNKHYQQLRNILNYCAGSFEAVETLSNKHKKVIESRNPFYKEYGEAIKVGEYILKKFSFNIDTIGQSQTLTPPFWIDMSKLFELYVFGKLRNVFKRPNEITYHDSFLGGKETDILIRAQDYECVVDCKYKPSYKNESPSLDDKRQLAGYTRLRSVYKKLNLDQSGLVRGLIIYPDQQSTEEITKETLFQTKIEEYVQFHKVGIKLPEL
jgi:5-methylcytosine-specific restriction enzyme subunit McrC